MALQLELGLAESSFDDYPLQNCFGSVLITTDSIVFRDGFTVDYFENRFTAEGVIEYSGDIDLSVDIELPNLDRYRGKLFLDQPGGRGIVHSRLTGRTSDPDLSGWFVSDSLWLYGMYADSAVAHFDKGHPRVLIIDKFGLSLLQCR